jgi:hypothetical protein
MRNMIDPFTRNKRNIVLIGMVALTVVIAILWVRHAAAVREEEERQTALQGEIEYEISRYSEAISRFDFAEGVLYLDKAKELSLGLKNFTRDFLKEDQSLKDHKILASFAVNIPEYLDSPPATPEEFDAIENAYDIYIKYRESINNPSLESLRAIRGALGILHEQSSDTYISFTFAYVRDVPFNSTEFLKKSDEEIKKFHNFPIVKDLAYQYLNTARIYFFKVLHLDRLSTHTLPYPLYHQVGDITEAFESIQHIFKDNQLRLNESIELRSFQREMYMELLTFIQNDMEIFLNRKKDLTKIDYSIRKIEYIADFMEKATLDIKSSNIESDREIMRAFTKINGLLPIFNIELTKMKENNNRIEREEAERREREKRQEENDKVGEVYEWLMEKVRLSRNDAVDAIRDAQLYGRMGTLIEQMEKSKRGYE